MAKITKAFLNTYVPASPVKTRISDVDAPINQPSEWLVLVATLPRSII